MPFQQFIYGEGLKNPRGHETAYKARYVQHEKDVKSYFSDRPCDLLEFDLKGGDWGPLTAFLGKPPVPLNISIPHMGGDGLDERLKTFGKSIHLKTLQSPRWRPVTEIQERLQKVVANDGAGRTAAEVLGVSIAAIWLDDTPAARAMRHAYDCSRWLQSRFYRRKNNITGAQWPRPKDHRDGAANDVSYYR